MTLFTPLYREIYCAINKDAPIIDAIEEAVRYAKREQANVILVYTDQYADLQEIRLCVCDSDNWRDVVEEFYRKKFCLEFGLSDT